MTEAMTEAGIFVTGTDTGIGKTTVSALLVSALHQSGIPCGYFKPVQTGTETDAEQVRALVQGRFSLPDSVLIPNPVYAFPEPIAPHRAAALHGVKINLEVISSRWQELTTVTDSAVKRPWIVEGAGGLLVPLGADTSFRDLTRKLGLRILVVASTRLGTINHTLLTIEAARNHGNEIAGIVWVGDEDPTLEQDLSQNFRSLGLSSLLQIRVPHFAAVDSNTIHAHSSRIFPVSILKLLFGDSGQTQNTESGASLTDRDQQSVWHPFSQHGLKQPILPVRSAHGAYVELENGKKILDGISSWWVNIHGHSHPSIASAISRQAARMEHMIFAGFTHEPGVALAELLLRETSLRKAEFTKVFYSDNGSTCVEVALKMAFQYHYNRGSRTRTRFLALRNSYHGDTLGAMAVGEPDGFHTPFRKLLPQVDFLDLSDDQAMNSLEWLSTQLKENPELYAGFIFEPLVQGAAGMLRIEADVLNAAMEICRKHDVLTIGDEVFTGFYRTGKAFAFEHLKKAPELLCLSKGITGGFLPLAVTLASEKVFQAFYSSDLRKGFLHGHSYTANPLACAAALESWKLLQEPACQASIEMIVRKTRLWTDTLRTHPQVKTTRCLGTIGAIELHGDEAYLDLPIAPSSRTVGARALERGVLLRPLGRVLYSVPPYCVTEQELDLIYQTMGEIIQ